MPDDKVKEPFQSWALVEIMGHVRLAGLITEESLFGSVMLRVDVPNAEGETVFTRYFGGSSIYSISPVTKEIAIALAKNICAKPVTVYDIEPQRQLAGRFDRQDDEMEFGDR